MRGTKALAALGVSSVALLTLAAEPAGAQTVVTRRAVVVDNGFAVANTGVNHPVVGNTSTNTGTGTNTSTGTARVTTGRAVAVGSISWTWLRH